MGFGPNVESAERTSQATPFAEDFLQVLQGFLTQSAGGQTTGPLQGNLGASPAAALGGINTAAGVTNQTPGLIEALTRQSQIATDRGVAQSREGLSLIGSRLGTSAITREGQVRGEAQAGLDQVIAQLLLGQSQRETQAQQFDVGANQAFLNLLAQVAGLGVVPSENIVSPGLGSQLLGAGANIGASAAGS